MPRPLGHIRILLSSRVVFDLEEADRIFAEKGAAEYTDYMRARGAYQKDYDADAMGRKLAPGPLWNFVAAALKLNEAFPGAVEGGLFCKDTAETALPIFRNLDTSGEDISYRISTAGKPLTLQDLKAFGADLFLSRNPSDVQMAIDNDVAAATINFPAGASYERLEGRPLRLWLDGDAVTFGSSAEVGYQRNGLERYIRDEFNAASQGVEAGPFTTLLAKISQLNKGFPKGAQPFELSLLTARGGLAAARVLTTVEKLGVDFNGELYFVSGASKTDVLRAHSPDIFFDDQQTHLIGAASFCPTGHVAYKTGSPIQHFLQEQAKTAPPPSSATP